MSDSAEILRTALYQKHVALGAKMVPFAGFEMPLQYTGLKDEHIAVRTGVGMFDVSHMGEFMVSGPEAVELVQWISSNDASVLEDGKVQYSCMPNGKGGIVDDLLIYRMARDRYMLVVNASNIEKDLNWINSQNRFDCKVRDLSDNLSLLAVQGPKATAAIQSLTDMDLGSMEYYTHQSGKFAGIDEVLISTTGYTGAGGFEIYVSNGTASKVWDAIMEAGASEGIKPAGLAARDTLRLEMGFCLYGNDIDDSTSPIEAGLGWITKFTKDFVDRELLEKQKTEKPSRKLVAFELTERGIPRQGYEIQNLEGETMGHVTSGTMGPSIDKAIGLGYVKKGFTKSGTELQIIIRNKPVKAAVVKLPFYVA